MTITHNLPHRHWMSQQDQMPPERLPLPPTPNPSPERLPPGEPQPGLPPEVQDPSLPGEHLPIGDPQPPGIVHTLAGTGPAR